MKKIAILIPAYNEEDSVMPFYKAMTGVTKTIKGYQFEFLFVDDGSQDNTVELIKSLHKKDKRVSLISLSRNFGKEAAMSAGIDRVDADAVAIFDADLQDPPTLLPEFVQKWEDGFDVVYAQRNRRDGETWIKKATASLFYKIIGRLAKMNIPQDTGDCRLMSRRVIEALRELRENHRFMKGLFAWVGFPSYAVKYDRDPRVAGETKFNYWKLWNFALEGITSFTAAPIKIATYLGMLIASGAMLVGVTTIIKTLVYGETVKGYPSLMVAILFLGGIQLFFIGIIGEYLGRVFGESKKRPLYFIADHLQAKPGPKKKT